MPFDEFFATTYVNDEDSGYKRDCECLLNLATTCRDYLRALDVENVDTAVMAVLLAKMTKHVTDFFPETSMGLAPEDLPTFTGGYEQRRAPREVRRRAQRALRKRATFKDGKWVDDEQPSEGDDTGAIGGVDL